MPRTLSQVHTGLEDPAVPILEPATFYITWVVAPRIRVCMGVYGRN